MTRRHRFDATSIAIAAVVGALLGTLLMMAAN